MASPPSRDQILVHFFRAVVAHGDVSRQRMDATTNWAAATTAAMISFAFGSVESPHFVLLIALAFLLVFLLMESRRYQNYDLWRRRVNALNRYLISPALSGRSVSEEMDAEARRLDEEGLRALAENLSHSVPAIPLPGALGYRLRRNYGYFVLVLVLAWLLKLEMHPTPANRFAQFVDRAAVGPLPGETILVGMVGLLGLLGLLAAAAPTGMMKNWQDVPPSLLRLKSLGGGIRTTKFTETELPE